MRRFEWNPLEEPTVLLQKRGAGPSAASVRRRLANQTLGSKIWKGGRGE